MQKGEQSPRAGFTVETGNVRIRVSAYANHLKLIGYVYLNINTRSTARRPSDLIKSFPDKYMTLADTKIYDITGEKLLDEKPFVVINMDLTEVLHAEEVEEKDSSL